MPEIYDAAIVGGGAAGLSAALVLGRSCRSVLVLDDGRPRNAVVDRMHGFLSRDGTPPGELLTLARGQLERYRNVESVAAHVDAIEGANEAFFVQTSRQERFTARRLLLATGVYDELPAIEGIDGYWGRFVFSCPYCDGWEMRGKRLAVAGKGNKAVDLAQELRQWTDDLIVCTQGEELSSDSARWLRAAGAKLYLSPIARLAKDGRLRIEFSDSSADACDGLFVTAPLRQRYPLVEMLRCRVRPNGEIDTDEQGRTSVKGVYAAGDAVTSVHQVMLACASGICAAMAINEDLLEEEVRAVLRTAD